METESSLGSTELVRPAPLAPSGAENESVIRAFTTEQYVAKVRAKNLSEAEVSPGYVLQQAREVHGRSMQHLHDPMGLQKRTTAYSSAVRLQYEKAPTLAELVSMPDEEEEAAVGPAAAGGVANAAKASNDSAHVVAVIRRPGCGAAGDGSSIFAGMDGKAPVIKMIKLAGNGTGVGHTAQAGGGGAVGWRGGSVRGGGGGGGSGGSGRGAGAGTNMGAGAGSVQQQGDGDDSDYGDEDTAGDIPIILIHGMSDGEDVDEDDSDGEEVQRQGSGLGSGRARLPPMPPAAGAAARAESSTPPGCAEATAPGGGSGGGILIPGENRRAENLISQLRQFQRGSAGPSYRSGSSVSVPMGSSVSFPIGGCCGELSACGSSSGARPAAGGDVGSVRSGGAPYTPAPPLGPATKLPSPRPGLDWNLLRSPTSPLSPAAAAVGSLGSTASPTMLPAAAAPAPSAEPSMRGGRTPGFCTSISGGSSFSEPPPRATSFAATLGSPGGFGGSRGSGGVAAGVAAGVSGLSEVSTRSRCASSVCLTELSAAAPVGAPSTSGSPSAAMSPLGGADKMALGRRPGACGFGSAADVSLRGGHANSCAGSAVLPQPPGGGGGAAAAATAAATAVGAARGADVSVRVGGAGMRAAVAAAAPAAAAAAAPAAAAAATLGDGSVRATSYFGGGGGGSGRLALLPATTADHVPGVQQPLSPYPGNSPAASLFRAITGSAPTGRASSIVPDSLTPASYSSYSCGGGGGGGSMRAAAMQREVTGLQQHLLAAGGGGGGEGGMFGSGRHGPPEQYGSPLRMSSTSQLELVMPKSLSVSTKLPKIIASSGGSGSGSIRIGASSGMSGTPPVGHSGQAHGVDEHGEAGLATKVAKGLFGFLKHK